MDLTPEQRDLLALRLVPGIGPRLTAALLERFGSAAEVFRAAPHELAQVSHIGGKLAGALHAALGRLDVDKELELMARHGVRLLAADSADYPGPLATVGDAPTLLYVRGAWIAGDANAVAIVGSRQCTSYGKRVAGRLAEDLARAGITVVSGLARGIDGAAHRGALKAGGRTIAVMAGGLAKIYPPEHAELAVEVQNAGALVSESAMSMEPMAGMFPARNRIISALSRGVVVVEAAEKSGALITARHAAEQGRNVFAVPGPVDSAESAGTLKLIRDGATLIRGAADIIEELDGIKGDLVARPQKEPPQLDPSQKLIWEFLAEAPRHIDEISRQLQMPVAPLLTALLPMEMQKVVRRLTGNRFERI